MKEFTLDIYKGNKKVKTVKAEPVIITRGVIKKLTKIVNLINDGNSIKTMIEAFDPVQEMLELLFPDVTEEEWDGVKIEDAIKLIIDLPKDIFTDSLDLSNNNE